MGLGGFKSLECKGSKGLGCLGLGLGGLSLWGLEGSRGLGCLGLGFTVVAPPLFPLSTFWLPVSNLGRKRLEWGSTHARN